MVFSLYSYPSFHPVLWCSEGARQQLEMLRIEMRHRAATLLQAVWRGWHFRRRWPTLKRNLELRLRTRPVRPRPQPIAGTPPPDVMDRCDQKTIQQTCSLFGLDLVRKLIITLAWVSFFILCKAHVLRKGQINFSYKSYYAIIILPLYVVQYIEYSRNNVQYKTVYGLVSTFADFCNCVSSWYSTVYCI